MMKIVRLERQMLLDFVDQDRLCDFVRDLPEVRKAITKVSRATRGNYSDSIAELGFEPDGCVRVDFEIRADKRGGRR